MFVNMSDGSLCLVDCFRVFSIFGLCFSWGVQMAVSMLDRWCGVSNGLFWCFSHIFWNDCDFF